MFEIQRNFVKKSAILQERWSQRFSVTSFLSNSSSWSNSTELLKNSLVVLLNYFYCYIMRYYVVVCCK